MFQLCWQKKAMSENAEQQAYSKSFNLNYGIKEVSIVDIKNKLLLIWIKLGLKKFVKQKEKSKFNEFTILWNRQINKNWKGVRRLNSVLWKPSNNFM